VSTPEPDPSTTVLPQQRTGWRRFRPGRRGAVIGAVIVAVLVVGAVVAALLHSDGGRGHRDDRGRGGPELAMNGEVDELSGFGEPGRRGDGPGRGFGVGDRLGDDTLLAGSVVSATQGSLVVTPDGAPQRTLRTDGDTRVRGSGNTGLGDLQAGERVVVRIDGTGEAARAVAVLVPPARVTGTVTAVAADRVTVVQLEGLAATVDVTALTQKPVVGDLVVLTGTALDGTTLRADGVRFLPKAA
jgi:hypothetical protein